MTKNEALEQEPLNLNCKSVQKRLATQWGYVEQPAQEPVYVVGKGWNCDEMPAEGTKLYTHPAPSWQGLSDDEIAKLNLDGYADEGELKFARSIEQALRNKYGY